MFYYFTSLFLLASYSLCAFSFELITNSIYLESAPIIVQTLLSQQRDMNDITQAVRLRYAQGDISPNVQLLWQKKLPKPLSQPILVGRPDFPFPDRWPWTNNMPHPPENAMNAEKYSDFSTKYMSRPSLIYQIDGHYHLHAFDLETGETRLDFELSKIFTTPLLAKHMEVDAASALMQADVFYDNQWHSLLVGIIGSKSQAVFCIDVSDASSLSSEHDNLNILWTLEDEHTSFSQPTLARLADNTWHLILAQKNFSTDCVPDSLEDHRLENICFATGFKMISFKTGFVSQDIKVMSLLTDDMIIHSNNSSDKNPIQFSAMTAIDSKARGYVDYLYVGDNRGTLWKFELETKFLPQVGFVNQSAIFSMKNNEVHGEILSPPKIVLHPEQGFLISFLAKYSNSAQRYLVNIWDKGGSQSESSYLFSALARADSVVGVDAENWYIPIGHERAYPLIRNKQVITVLQANQLISKDMLSSQTLAQGDYLALLQSASQPSLAFVGAPLVFFQGAQQPNLFLHGLADGSFAWTELDLNDRIGRRAWRELNY